MKKIPYQTKNYQQTTENRQKWTVKKRRDHSKRKTHAKKNNKRNHMWSMLEQP